MKGRHSAAGQPLPESPETTRPALVDDVRNGDGRCGPDAPEGDADPRRLLKKLALWAGLALCVAFIAWVAWGFLQFDHDIDHPREGGFSGWQCDAGRDCGS
ncbi:hypothetical protein RM550_21430 [Streptomyces sp. DSM 41527]|uniref:Uncharacterized protein n=1 Tax=Streptomyces mooreae TaxID=3075523 RepID=A0ABU2TBF9_9ACTN|nr:hypothetical protein [Streptomyces sp. DSM 41527]MDT0458268.1 hypothetical protein [Streptomyces sp. DSM 41527]